MKALYKTSGDSDQAASAHNCIDDDEMRGTSGRFSNREICSKVLRGSY